MVEKISNNRDHENESQRVGMIWARPQSIAGCFELKQIMTK